MNDRIRVIAIQTDVWCDQNHAGDDHYDIMWEQKFAELIVRECAQFVEDKFDFVGDEIIVKEEMLKHFGVPE
jgi:hypothetical protein